MNFCCWEPPSLWWFVTSATGNPYTHPRARATRMPPLSQLTPRFPHSQRLVDPFGVNATARWLHLITAGSAPPSPSYVQGAGPATSAPHSGSQLLLANSQAGPGLAEVGRADPGHSAPLPPSCKPPSRSVQAPLESMREVPGCPLPIGLSGAQLGGDTPGGLDPSSGFRANPPPPNHHFPRPISFSKSNARWVKSSWI